MLKIKFLTKLFTYEKEIILFVSHYPDRFIVQF